MRDAVLGLEAECRRLQGYRKQVVEIQKSLLEARLNDARRALVELLTQWPTN